MDTVADPYDTATWSDPCWNCGHTPGVIWDPDCHYAHCPHCGAD